MKQCDIVVIGGGPAGLSASVTASKLGHKVILVEREARLGGILKQCIHDGFGTIRHNSRLTGPEYADREVNALLDTDVEVMTLTFVTNITRDSNNDFVITTVTKEGICVIKAHRLILATGCRERTGKQIAIHGTNPSGVMTAGTAQYYINILGKQTSKRCVILGSGDIGLIMARRLTLEGAKVVGVYEAKNSPSGLTRNIVQCLDDYNIPLYLSHTVTRVFGNDRLTAVEVCQVDDKMTPIAGTNTIIECDSLILSVGLIPENEIASSLGVTLSASTKGPICDQSFACDVEGVYVCGNACHVNDLADYVSESGTIAGQNAMKSYSSSNRVEIAKDNNILYVVPQCIDTAKDIDKCIIYFRASRDFANKKVVVRRGQEVVFTKQYQHLRPPEMERIVVNFGKANVADISISLE